MYKHQLVVHNMLQNDRKLLDRYTLLDVNDSLGLQLLEIFIGNQHVRSSGGAERFQIIAAIILIVQYIVHNSIAIQSCCMDINDHVLYYLFLVRKAIVAL